MITQAGRRIIRKGNFMRTSKLLNTSSRLPVVLLGGLLIAVLAPPALAEDAPAAPPSNAAPAPYLKITGHIEAGITANPDSQRVPASENWGHLFTDRSNRPLLNQVSLAVEHDIDSSAKTFNWGFRVQAVYGSDSRYTHTLGILNNATNSINQLDFQEADIQAHVPAFTAGGMDVKAGIYPTLEGAEVMDGTGNFFYSHNYIFNFGVPLKHTGVMTTTHFKKFDLYLGVDSGVNTSFGNSGDTNGAPAFHGGIGFNVGKNITVLATTHIGAENARGSIPNYNKALRYLNDMVITVKLSPKLTSLTDINYIRDDGYKVSGGGVSEQLVYTVTDQVSVGARGEIWSDTNGFFVAAFPGNHDFILTEKGLYPASNTTIFAPAGGTTYGALTFGVNWKPKLPAVTKNFSMMIRPEARFDGSLGHSRPFHALTGVGDKSQMTFGVDAIVNF